MAQKRTRAAALPIALRHIDDGERTARERGAAPVSAGLQSRRTRDETGAVLELATLLVDERLPAGVSRERTERELCERKVAVFERMLAEGTAAPAGSDNGSPRPARSWPS